ncbi:EmrB/QacA subfamily drug resistance transporter [Motilibacter rhizosphaerae]|uniref:EmrB/QacA subfamily drug resistance transporter n=1 Tax=Motilibacter rhizosphaerae TaxID=598652 RepID=A0A4Q7NNQ1_9ACTN|nr:MFS transporter [Motilibacter rhizosphaerae]RZS86793.1 EmrB/QacA subfamily drug resistance transporter [Motilibacter rhizosphaerae]
MTATETAPRSGSEEPRPAEQGGGEQAGDPRRWRALAVCLVAAFMTLLDVSIVNVALPSIQKGLSASASDLQWVLSGYAVAFGLLLVPAGRLGDSYGRRLVFIIGVAGFTLASVLCGLAPSSSTLAGARLLQGAAAGLVIPQNAGVIQQLFRGKERGQAFGMLGAVIGLSTAVGPLAGGLLISAFGTTEGWRWIFFVNLPIGLVVLPFAWRLLPGRPEERGSRSLDPVGVVLLGVSVVLVLLPLVEESEWKGAAKWLLVPAGLLVAGLFLLWERRYARRGGAPVVDLGLFRLKSYALGNAIGSVYFAGFTGIFFVYTLFLQQGRGYSALEAGLAQVPFAVGSGVASAVGGKLVHRAGRPLVVAGLALVVVGLVATDLLLGSASGKEVGWVLAVPLLVAGVGSGLVIAPNTSISLSEVPPEGSGSASGVLQTGQRVGTALGIAAVGSVFFSALASSKGKDWSGALERGLLVATAFVVLSLLLGLLDLRGGRSRSHGRHERA